jgi:NAD(P)-dependent dehydrogenase (short-subunit alcohol dehydrogenase family)
MPLSGASALVTGGASGLGAATAARLHAAGARVVLADLPGDAGPRAAAAVGDGALFMAADVRDEGPVRAAVEAAAAAAPLRVAVAAAGIAPGARILGRGGPHPLADFQRVVDVNLVGAFNTLRLAAEAMAANEPDADGVRGLVVLTASVAAYEGQVGQAAYAASKAGVAGMTLAAARDLAPRGVRVVAIAPGAMDTPMVAGFAPELREALGAQAELPKRLGRPEEFAGLVLHLVENPFLNGEVIRLDGAARLPAR